MLRDSLAILRQENSQLMVEINELKNDFGLREDQVSQYLFYQRLHYFLHPCFNNFLTEIYDCVYRYKP